MILKNRRPTYEFKRTKDITPRKRENSVQESLDKDGINNKFQNYIELYRNVLHNQIHLVFSFASPLVNTLSSGKSFALPQLEFNKEFEQIENALKNSKTDLKYKRVVSNLENFSDILIKNPLVLHFSGHGVKNDVEHMGTEAGVYQGEGDMLLFEDNK